ncbi:MAG: heparan-alpha-glucosaminide N-acetyltransferase domain-containing protein [Anaerolineales bacterium]
MDKRGRLLALDQLRGILIILMALDHANFHIAHQHSSGEYWGGVFPSFSTPGHFLTRFVTHFCAPGFFFLMGISMVLFASARRKKGWKEKQIRLHFLLRGLFLIALQQLLNFGGIWSLPGSPGPLWYGGVLAALGFTMILSLLLLKVHPRCLLLISVLLFLGVEALTPGPAAWGKGLYQLPGVLLVYGGGWGNFWVNYPLLAWLEVTVFGLYFGKLIEKGENQAFRSGGTLGLLFLAGFAIIRVLNGFGNIRPLPLSSWMGFLSVVKYPPSMAYVLLTLGCNLILLWLLSCFQNGRLGDKNPLLVFGRTALFSYVSHILIYILLGRLITPSGSSLGVMYLLWLVGLGILYPLADWYGKFKAQQGPRSWVHFL